MKRIINSIYKKVIYDIQNNRNNNGSRLFIRNKATRLQGNDIFMAFSASNSLTSQIIFEK